MNLKAIVLSTIAAVSTIVAPTAVGAYEVDYGCGQIRGWSVCVSYQDRDSDDIIYINGPQGEDRMTISCYGDGSYEWRSYGYNTQSFNEYIAEGFCED